MAESSVKLAEKNLGMFAKNFASKAEQYNVQKQSQTLTSSDVEAARKKQESAMEQAFKNKKELTAKRLEALSAAPTMLKDEGLPYELVGRMLSTERGKENVEKAHRQMAGYNPQLITSDFILKVNSVSVASPLLYGKKGDEFRVADLRTGAKFDGKTLEEAMQNYSDSIRTDGTLLYHINGKYVTKEIDVSNSVSGYVDTGMSLLATSAMVCVFLPEPVITKTTAAVIGSVPALYFTLRGGYKFTESIGHGTFGWNSETLFNVADMSTIMVPMGRSILVGVGPTALFLTAITQRGYEEISGIAQESGLTNQEKKKRIIETTAAVGGSIALQVILHKRAQAISTAAVERAAASERALARGRPVESRGTEISSILKPSVVPGYRNSRLRDLAKDVRIAEKNLATADNELNRVTEKLLGMVRGRVDFDFASAMAERQRISDKRGIALINDLNAKTALNSELNRTKLEYMIHPTTRKSDRPLERLEQIEKAIEFAAQGTKQPMGSPVKGSWIKEANVKIFSDLDTARGLLLTSNEGRPSFILNKSARLSPGYVGSKGVMTGISPVQSEIFNAYKQAPFPSEATLEAWASNLAKKIKEAPGKQSKEQIIDDARTAVRMIERDMREVTNVSYQTAKSVQKEGIESFGPQTRKDYEFEAKLYAIEVKKNYQGKEVPESLKTLNLETYYIHKLTHPMVIVRKSYNVLIQQLSKELKVPFTPVKFY